MTSSQSDERDALLSGAGIVGAILLLLIALVGFTGLLGPLVPLFNQGSRTLTIPTDQSGRASLALPSTSGVIEVEIPSAYIGVAGSTTLALSESELSDGITLLVIDDCQRGCTLRLDLNGEGPRESEATVRYIARDSEYVDTLDAFVELD